LKLANLITFIGLNKSFIYFLNKSLEIKANIILMLSLNINP